MTERFGVGDTDGVRVGTRVRVAVRVEIGFGILISMVLFYFVIINHIYFYS